MQLDYYKEKYPDIYERRIEIVNRQLFGICENVLTKAIVERTLYCEVVDSDNIVYLENYRKRMIKEEWADIIKKEFGENMKFDVVIGNPPYQDDSGRSSIYNKFVSKSIMLADTVSMITRDNWMNGKAFKDMRDKMLERGCINKIVHFPKVGEVFEDLKVSVAYFLWTKGDKGKTEYRCIKDKKECLKQELDLTDGVLYKSEIGKEVLEKIGGKSNWGDIYKTRCYAFMDQRKRNNMEQSKSLDDKYNITVMVNKGNPIYVNINNFVNTNEIIKYKVVCGVIINEASIESPGNVLTNIKAIGRNVVASETWSLVATFDTEDEAINCKKYIMTKFVRFIANQSVNGRSNVTDNTFEYVPVQNFTNNSDIDWSQSISSIDNQLYKKYKLSNEEISYIDKTIKSIE